MKELTLVGNPENSKGEFHSNRKDRITAAISGFFEGKNVSRRNVKKTRSNLYPRIGPGNSKFRVRPRTDNTEKHYAENIYGSRGTVNPPKRT